MKLRSVRNFSGIVFCQARFEVIGESDIEVLLAEFRFQDVNVAEWLHGTEGWLAEPKPER